jgi:hypothetical protein
MSPIAIILIIQSLALGVLWVALYKSHEEVENLEAELKHIKKLEPENEQAEQRWQEGMSILDNLLTFHAKCTVKPSMEKESMIRLDEVDKIFKEMQELEANGTHEKAN